jgi:hypothetical protein
MFASILAAEDSRRRWGIPLSDPLLDIPGTALVPLLARQTLYKSPEELAPGQLTLAFDLSLPLRPQVRFALALLLALRREVTVPKRRPRLARKKFPLYLRVLDARAAGASYQDIADGLDLQGDIEKVRELLRQAREWTKPERYLLIAGSSPVGSFGDPQ